MSRGPSGRCTSAARGSRRGTRCRSRSTARRSTSPARATRARCASASPAVAIPCHTCNASRCTAARRWPSSSARCIMTDLIVETTHGKVRGERHGEVGIWKGIPYAEPPFGALRFRPPRPPATWSGVRDATHFGTVAAQSRDPRIAILSGIGERGTSGEDCLFVNVFAPFDDAGQPAGPHPVMVWIHGGAFVMGSGSTPLYHGTPFAHRGIVVVTLNYRLGIPGLLYLGDLAPGYDDGNCGLLDQVAALRWVQDNIAAFGGDPGCVTIMGESAGAISIGTLLAMPAARGLFHRAILESGAPSLSPPTRDDATK